MRFTITPLGGAKRSVHQAVADIVKYLIAKEKPLPSPAGGEQPTSAKRSGPARYYADRGDEPGRWRGRGAAEMGLDGEVDREDFARVLAGRHPRTGARLITAQGSAGRRPRLGVGSETLWDDAGDGIYDESDTAAAVDVEKDEAVMLLDTGTRVAAFRLFAFLAVAGAGPGTGANDRGSLQGGSGSAGDLPGGTFLVPIIDLDGNRWVTEAELTRYEDARAAGVDPDAVAADGDPEDLLPLVAAARLAGVTPRYLRGLAKRYEENRSMIDEVVAAGRRPRKAYLVAERGSRGRWLVNRAELVDYLRRREPPAVRVGYDLTLTTEKSLSVLALLADQRTGKQVLDAIQTANDQALDWFETHGAAARHKGKGVRIDGWTVASFRHLTSRALDPFAHWHNVVPNTVKTADGTRRALDARGLYRHAKAASALATAEARWQLTTRLGVRWRPARKGGWEIAGIPDQMLDAFSQRRTEVDDALRELEEAIGRGARPDEVEQIVLRTRPAKQQADVDDLRSEWWQRAQRLGFHESDLAACLYQTHSVEQPDPEWTYATLAAPQGICRNLSVFGYDDVLASLADLPVPQSDGSSPQPLLVPATRLEELAHGYVRSSHVVQLIGGRDALYTVQEMLGTQDRIVARFEAGLDSGSAVVRRPSIDVALAAHPQLTGEQRRLVERFCSSGHRIQSAIGYPGAGKTTSMAAAQTAWETDGWRVVGAAVKGEAARLLADATGMPTETLAWWLAHDDPLSAPLDALTVLVVDEASTISDRDRLGWLCEQTGATLRLVGDPGQHGAVEAGGMFRVLCERYPQHTPALTQTHRVRHQDDRAAADALRAGDVDTALDLLEIAGHLHIVEDETDFYRQILQRWWAAHQAGLDHPMVDRRNLVRHRLNRLAHRLLQAAGEVGTNEIAASGDRSFSVGDRVIARTPARDLHAEGQPRAYVRNGATGRIVHLHRGERSDADSITVNFDCIGTVTVPRTYFDAHEATPGHVDVGLDHAYAITSYAVQGSTRKLSTSRIDERSTRAEMLVDITRGERANHLYLTRTDGQLDGEQLPRTPPPPIDQAVAAKLRRAQGEITAWELAHDHDPTEPFAPPEASPIGL